jgi:hypothetical protein
MTQSHSVVINRNLAVGMLALTLAGGFAADGLPAQAGNLGTDVATSFKEKQQVPHRTISVNNRPSLILRLNRTCEERLQGFRGAIRMHWTDGATGNVNTPVGSLSSDSFQRQGIPGARNTAAIRPNNREDCPLILREIRELLQSRLSFC